MGRIQFVAAGSRCGASGGGVNEWAFGRKRGRIHHTECLRRGDVEEGSELNRKSRSLSHNRTVVRRWQTRSRGRGMQRLTTLWPLTMCQGIRVVVVVVLDTCTYYEARSRPITRLQGWERKVINMKHIFVQSQTVDRRVIGARLIAFLNWV